MFRLFGGKDPFDDPFFTLPFGGKNLFDDPFFSRPFDRQAGSRKPVTIEELNPDNDSGKDPVPSNDLVAKNPHDSSNGLHSFCYQRVAYGGLNGMYYASSMCRRTGDDEVSMMEIKEEDNTVGEARHTVSRGIRDKGHSITTRHNSDGRVDSIQTLHNLNEEELAGFEEAWKADATSHLPGWNSGLSFLENAGGMSNVWDGLATWGGWALPSLEQAGNAGAEGADGEQNAQIPSQSRRKKKVVRVNVE